MNSLGLCWRVCVPFVDQSDRLQGRDIVRKVYDKRGLF